MAIPPKKFQFTYGQQEISCELYPPHHLTKKAKISLSLTPEHILKIRAPKKTTHQEIITILEKYKDWIAQQVNKQHIKQEHAHKLEFIQSEKHLFLGQYYALDIFETNTQKPNVQIINQTLKITVRYNTPEKIAYLLNSWYRFQAIDLFSKRICAIQPSIPWIDWEKHPPLLRIKKMTSRWGSYIHHNPRVITLNQHLIKAAVPYIDYVILHELCHEIVPNHSKSFYTLMTQIMPDWKKWQSQLQQQSSLLLYNPIAKRQN